MTIRVRIHVEDPISAIGSLEGYFRNGGVSIIQAAFTHTYFAHPDAVREKTPFFPDRARRSREHYPNLDKGARSTWRAGDGCEVILETTRGPRWPGSDTLDTDWRGDPVMEYGTYGATRTIRRRSPLAGTCAICRSGREC